MKAIRERIHKETHWLVTSEWLDEAKDTKLRIAANRDYFGVRGSDLLVKFPDTVFSSLGGKHQEMGLAIGLGIPVVVVGPAEGILDYLDLVPIHRVTNEEVLIDWLRNH